MTKTVLNGAEMAVLINRFEGIARKMTNTLYRTGRSGVLNRARDFSCCIVTAQCELLATADSLPDAAARRQHDIATIYLSHAPRRALPPLTILAGARRRSSHGEREVEAGSNDDAGE